MTWVVAYGGLGYGVMIADCRVTYGSGPDAVYSQGFGVQKIYPLANNLCVGLCGSVDLGLHFATRMRRFAAERWPRRSPLPSDYWDHWWERLERLYSQLVPRDMRDLSCTLVLVGVSEPTGPVPWGPSTLWQLELPAVTSGALPTARKLEPFEAVSIGSGSHIDEYVEALNSLPRSVLDRLIEMQGRLPGGVPLASSMIGRYIGEAVRGCRKEASVGEELLGATITARATVVSESILGQDALAIEVAASMEELLRLEARHGFGMAVARQG